jgi:hyperosmotically inducible protein
MTRVSVLFTFLIAIASLLPAQGAGDRAQARILKEVGHELRMLPYFTVFDNLTYQVNGNQVVLTGQVTKPTLKEEAGRVVKAIEGVESVTNNIEVLPASPMDDQTRVAVFRAVYGKPGMDRYSHQAMPSIHIIVKNGHVTLEGYVDNEGDKNRAGIYANGVPGVFSVTNNLKIG